MEDLAKVRSHISAFLLSPLLSSITYFPVARVEGGSLVRRRGTDSRLSRTSRLGCESCRIGEHVVAPAFVHFPLLSSSLPVYTESPYRLEGENFSLLIFRPNEDEAARARRVVLGHVFLPALCSDPHD